MEDRLDEKDLPSSLESAKTRMVRRNIGQTLVLTTLFAVWNNANEIVHKGSRCGTREDITAIMMAMQTIAVVLN